MNTTYIHGKKNRACVSLLDHLQDLGVDVATVGHNNKHNRRAKLFVDLRTNGNRDKVPPTWHGFPVIITVGSHD